MRSRRFGSRATFCPSSTSRWCSGACSSPPGELSGARYAALGVTDQSRRRARAVHHARHRRGRSGTDRRSAEGARGARRADRASGAAAAGRRGRPSALLRLSARPSADEDVPGGPGADRRRPVREPVPDREGRRRGVHRGGRADDHAARRVRGRGDRPRAPLLRPGRSAHRAQADRRRARRDHADRAGARRGDRSRSDPGARGQARTSAGGRPRAGDRARAGGRDGRSPPAPGELPAGLVGRACRCSGQPGQRARSGSRSTLRLEDQPNRARFERARPRSARRPSRRRIGGPIGLPRTRLRRADRGRPARRRAGVQRRGPAAAGGVRGQRGDGGRDRGDGRRRAPPAAASRRPSRNALTGPASYTTRRCRTSAALRLGLAAQLQGSGPEAAIETVREAVAELEREIRTLRALVTDLRPAALDDLGAQAAIEDLAERARGRGLEVDLAIDLAYEQGRTAGPAC